MLTPSINRVIVNELKTLTRKGNIIMSRFEMHLSLQLSQRLGMGSLRSERCDDRSFEPTIALCEGDGFA